MAGIDPRTDPRGAHWEQRLRRPVMAAALIAPPTVFLYFSKLEGWVAILAVTLAWSIWVVFVVEAAIMLTVVQDRWGWVRGHLPKAGKLIKSALILRKDGTIVRHPVVSSVVILALAAMLVGIGHRVVSGEKHATPLHNAVDLVDG